MKHKFRTRILVLVGLLACMTACLCLGIFSRLLDKDIYAATTQISTNWLPSIIAISNVRSEFNETRRTDAQALFNPGSCVRTGCQSEMRVAREKFSAMEKIYETLITRGEERVLFDMYKKKRDSYFYTQNNILQSTVDGKQLQDFLSESATNFVAVNESIDALLTFNTNGGKKTQADFINYYDKSERYLSILNAILALTAAAILARIIFLITETRGASPSEVDSL